jgi:hypothetical protein
MLEYIISLLHGFYFWSYFNYTPQSDKPQQKQITNDSYIIVENEYIDDIIKKYDHTMITLKSLPKRIVKYKSNMSHDFLDMISVTMYIQRYNNLIIIRLHNTIYEWDQCSNILYGENNKLFDYFRIRPYYVARK